MPSSSIFNSRRRTAAPALYLAADAAARGGGVWALLSCDVSNGLFLLCNSDNSHNGNEEADYDMNPTGLYVAST